MTPVKMDDSFFSNTVPDLDEILDQYFQNIDSAQRADFVALAAHDIALKILKDHAETIREEAERTQRQREQERRRQDLRRKLDEARTFILITVLLAFLVGLLTNQVTELLAYFKGDPFWLDGTLTWGVIGCVALVIFLLYKAMYLDEVDRLIQRIYANDGDQDG